MATRIRGEDGQTARAVAPSASGTPAYRKVTSRKPRLVTKEAPIAVRCRPGTRDRLRKRAGDRPLSVVVEQAIDAYLGRRVVEVDPNLRAALSAELSAVADRLAEIAHQEVGIGRNRNQLQLFVNAYREIPLNLAAEMREENRLHQSVLDALGEIRDRLDALVTTGVA